MSQEMLVYLKGFCQATQCIDLVLIVAGILVLCLSEWDTKRKVDVRTIKVLAIAEVLMIALFALLPSHEFWGMVIAK